MIDTIIGFMILFGCFGSYMLGRQHERNKHNHRIMNDAEEIALGRSRRRRDAYTDLAARHWRNTRKDADKGRCTTEDFEEDSA
jgi:hypothetical protein